MIIIEKLSTILFADAKDVDNKRDNANINTDAPMGVMLKIGTETANQFADNYVIPKEFVQADKENWIHIHDKDFSLITFNCCQIDLLKLFRGGFSTGHGYLREPNSIRSYANLACIAIQSNQNDMFGGQSINAFDFAMAEGVRKSFKKAIIKQLTQGLIYGGEINALNLLSNNFHLLDWSKIKYKEFDNYYIVEEIIHYLCVFIIEKLKINYTKYENVSKFCYTVYKLACKEVEEETHQAMEAVVHNFNTLHSRAGAQVPFSSLNYGMDTSPEGRLVTKELLLAIEAGLGNGETPIFPISVFVLKEGVNYNKNDVNYDLFKLACKVSAKRLFPNFENLDAPFNKQYYKPNDYNSFVATMGALDGAEHLYIKIDDGQPIDISIKDFFEYCKTGALKKHRPCQIFFNKIPLKKQGNKKEQCKSGIKVGCGVYAITYLPEDITYIGSSSDVNRRWREHKSHIKLTGGIDAGAFFGDTNLSHYKFEVLEYTQDYATKEKEYIETIPNINFKGVSQRFYKIESATTRVYERPNFKQDLTKQQELISLKNKNIKVLDRDNKWVKINHVFKNDAKNSPSMMHIIYKDNDKEFCLNCTEDHPLYISNNKFLRADMLKTGDKIYRADGKELQVVDICWNTTPKDSYDIGTATGSFIGSDIIMHNCRTRVMGNVNGAEISGGRGNFSFVTINLPKLAIESKKDIGIFWNLLEKYIRISHDYLLHRLSIIEKKKVFNFPFLMGEGVWLDSEKLSPNDTIKDVLKHASFSIGFCGLAECLKMLIGKHHGESVEAQKLGLGIIKYLRQFTDKYTEEEHLNWSTFATPAESCAGKFQKANQEQYGIIDGVTDKEYMTNSFHVPVYYPIKAIDKINIEAPYHKLCNAGHISYIELDGDTTKNLIAFETIVRAMHDADMGYFSINHPVDRDSVCGYTGIINNICPKCGRTEKEHKQKIIIKRKKVVN